MANRREFTASSLAGKVERKVNAKTVKEMYEKLLFLYFPVTAFIWADSFYQPHDIFNCSASISLVTVG